MRMPESMFFLTSILMVVIGCKSLGHMVIPENGDNSRTHGKEGREVAGITTIRPLLTLRANNNAIINLIVLLCSAWNVRSILFGTVIAQVVALVWLRVGLMESGWGFCADVQKWGVNCSDVRSITMGRIVARRDPPLD